VITDNVQGSQESIVLPSWETKEDMDAFYQLVVVVIADHSR